MQKTLQEAIWIFLLNIFMPQKMQVQAVSDIVILWVMTTRKVLMTEFMLLQKKQELMLKPISIMIWAWLSVVP